MHRVTAVTVIRADNSASPGVEVDAQE